MESTYKRFLSFYGSLAWTIDPANPPPLLFFPILLDILLAYLLFSPKPTVLLRRTLLLAFILPFTLLFAFSFHAPKTSPDEIGRVIGFRFFFLIYSLRGIEVGLMKEPPEWIETSLREGERRIDLPHGVVQDFGQRARYRRDPEPRKPTGRYEQLVFGVSYFFSLRNLGWSNGFPKLFPEYYEPQPRGSLLVFTFWRMLMDLVIWDLAGGVWNLSPTLSSYADRSRGSIWDPLPLPGGLVTLPPLLSAILLSTSLLFTLSSAYSFFHSASVFIYTLLSRHPDPSPPIYGSIYKVTSVSSFWAHHWHQTFRRMYTFLGGLPGQALGQALGGRPSARWGAVLGTFLIGGIHHWATWGVNVASPEMSEAAKLYFRVFLLQPVALALERLFFVLTGRKVGGPLGRIWGWTFLFWCGMPLVEAMAKFDAGVSTGCGLEGERNLKEVLGFNPGRSTVRFFGRKMHLG